ncbi:MAG: glutamate formimidoyltransferase [Bacteroidetes bacterium]|jgi:glutamate formiminotransferase/formiminotetrahydrofolate cyclodeaminase|nr:glutamate formimidoyltransferase [Bacteroidota bacterium]
MDKLIECVPNISEGNNKEIIKELESIIKAGTGITLLNTDIGRNANRTVFTYVGRPEDVIEVTFSLIREAAQLIDMRLQKGEHPRLGAVDVCPFVPLKNITLEETAGYAGKLAERVGNELNLSVYAYEALSNNTNRKSLEQIRKGEYEGLRKKITEDAWKPDYGPSVFNEKFGAIIMGARDFLIAYNVNLNTTNHHIAKRIAESIRESGKIVTENGMKKRVPGKLKSVKALGWYMDAFQCAQVSTNLTNFREVNLYDAYLAVEKEAEKHNVQVTGAELIGLVPEEALVHSYNSYIQAENLKPVDSKKGKMEAIIERLNLNSVKEFKLHTQVIEELLA